MLESLIVSEPFISLFEKKRTIIKPPDFYSFNTSGVKLEEQKEKRKIETVIVNTC